MTFADIDHLARFESGCAGGSRSTASGSRQGRRDRRELAVRLFDVLVQRGAGRADPASRSRAPTGFIVFRAIFSVITGTSSWSTISIRCTRVCCRSISITSISRRCFWFSIRDPSPIPRSRASSRAARISRFRPVARAGERDVLDHGFYLLEKSGARFQLEHPVTVKMSERGALISRTWGSSAIAASNPVAKPSSRSAPARPHSTAPSRAISIFR